jgi:hypothetical protein
MPWHSLLVTTFAASTAEHHQSVPVPTIEEPVLPTGPLRRRCQHPSSFPRNQIIFRFIHWLCSQAGIAVHRFRCLVGLRTTSSLYRPLSHDTKRRRPGCRPGAPSGISAPFSTKSTVLERNQSIGFSVQRGRPLWRSWGPIPRQLGCRSSTSCPSGDSSPFPRSGLPTYAWSGPRSYATTVLFPTDRERAAPLHPASSDSGPPRTREPETTSQGGPTAPFSTERAMSAVGSVAGHHTRQPLIHIHPQPLRPFPLKPPSGIPRRARSYYRAAPSSLQRKPALFPTEQTLLVSLSPCLLDLFSD